MLQLLMSQKALRIFFKRALDREVRVCYNEKSIGVSPSGKAPDFDSVMRRFESCHPSHNYGSLAQSAEHLTFNQGVDGSNPS